MITVELHHDDCIAAMSQMHPQSVDLILTDPPYNLGKFMKNRDTNLKQMRENYFGAAGWDDLAPDEWSISMNNFFAQASRVLRPRGAMVVFMAIIKVESLITIAEKNGFYYKTTGIWHKLNPMPRNMNLHFVNSTEAWMYFVIQSKTGTFNNTGSVVHDFIESSVTPASEKRYGKHPTQKPELLMEHFVELLSNPADTVLDPFMGSGSTGVASVRKNRNFVGVELSGEYFNVAQQRIQEVQNNATL